MAGQKREARLHADDPAIDRFKKRFFMDARVCPRMTIFRGTKNVAG